MSDRLESPGEEQGTPSRPVPGRSLVPIAWLATMAAIAAAFALLSGLARTGPAALALVVLSLATLALRYGLGWRGLPWPAALAADVAVAWAILGAAGPHPSEPPALALAAFGLLVVGHAGAFGLRTIVLGFEVRTFEYVQNAMLLALLLGGATLFGVPAAALGTASLLLAVGAYALAFLLFERRAPEGANYPYSAGAGLALTIAGAWLALPPESLGPVLAALALLTAVAARRHARHLLVLHAGLLALAGLAAAVFPWRGHASALVLTLLFVGATALQLVRLRAGPAVAPARAHLWSPRGSRSVHRSGRLDARTPPG